MVADAFIERKIVIGLITSTEYLLAIDKIWQPGGLSSDSARNLSRWCLDYYRKYNKAPGKEMQNIFAEKVRQGLNEDQAEEISSILQGLSNEHEDVEEFNVKYLVDQTKDYFTNQNLQILASTLKNSVESGELEQAETLVKEYMPIADDETTEVDPFADKETVKAVFTTAQESLIKFPKDLGRFWNDQLVRGGFVALLAPEKKGKSFYLLELAMRAIRARSKVAFFQAGDMTEEQQLRRIYIYLSRKSDKEKFCKELHLPSVDCWLNQTGQCCREEREGFDSLFPANFQQKEVTKELLLDAIKSTPDYSPCHNCKEMKGAVYLTEQEEVHPLEWKEAYQQVKKFRQKYGGLKLSTHPNDSLCVRDIDNLLIEWEKKENFKPDVVIIDYADILIADPDASKLDWRNQQNSIWKKLRKLSQEKDCLVITATQASASSYSKETIELSDFSEDKRKFAHVTAMYGMNQTPEEKKLGIMRLNELVVRESDFDMTRQIKILQCLQRGRPFIGSYF